MLTLNEYLTDPCGTLSIPFWKAQNIIVPENMSILHQRQLSGCLSSYSTVERYFRLRHDLQTTARSDKTAFLITGTDDVDAVVSVINRCYTDIQVNRPQVESWRHTPVFAPELWVLALNENQACVGCGVADFDPEAQELILEWIQVLPQFRRQGAGRAIVNELLRRGSACGARFATVSGRLDNETCPEQLYRACGFTGDDIWYICHT